MENLCNSIITGIVASLLFSIFLLLIRPRVKISNIICCNRGDNLSIYKIKIVNHTLSRLINVNYTLHYCTDYDDGLSDIQEIAAKKTILNTIEKLSFSNTDYAVRVTYELDETKYQLKDNTRLIFTFQATHPFSNTSICIKKTYTKDNLKNADFETGKSVKFILRERNL